MLTALKLEQPQTSAYRHFQSMDEVRHLVEQFEDCSLPKSKWNHVAHLTVAYWFLSQMDEADASCRMIQGIQRYNHARGIPVTQFGGYHETITLFWLAITRQYIQERGQDTIELASLNDFVGCYSERPDILFEHYSPERIRSWKARRTWVEPDLKPLDGEVVIPDCI